MLPAVEVQTPPEPYSAPLQVTTCDPEPKPGVVAFADFVLSHQGGRSLGISRRCASGKASEHHEGRAWDWGMDASNAEDYQRVQELLDWLLAPDLVTGEPHANFRRLGLRYVIWDRAIWSAGKKTWHPYSGSSPHTDHVHFSFGWPGALGKTSFFQWLAGPSEPPVEPPVVDVGARRWLPVAVAGVAATVGWLAAGRLR